MFKLFNKDLKLFFADKRSVLLTFLLPIILISLFALAFGGIGKSDSKVKPVKLLVADMDKSATSKKIITKLDSLKGLSLSFADIDKSRELILKGKYPGALIFHKGFEDSMGDSKDSKVELIYDKAREMEIGMLQPVLISGIMSSIGRKTVKKHVNKYLKKNYPDIDKILIDKILGDVENEEGNKKDAIPSFKMDSAIKKTSIVGDKKNRKSNLGLVHAVAGTAIMMLLFSVAGLGTSILEEKESGTIKRLLFSPISGSTILYGKMLLTFFIAVLQLTVMFLFAWLAFGLDIFVNVPALVLMILATAFAISSFGIFLAAVSKTRRQANSLSTLIILIMSAIGGSMMPLFIMPAIMQKVAVFSVNYWGIEGFYDIFWRKLPVSDILPKVFVLMGIGIFMTLLSIRLFRKNVLSLV